jgi:hypothetical protein
VQSLKNINRIVVLDPRNKLNTKTSFKTAWFRQKYKKNFKPKNSASISALNSWIRKNLKRKKGFQCMKIQNAIAR